MNFEIDIVSNSDRKTVRMQGLTYIYIPMAMHEMQKYGNGLINPCWRIKVEKETKKITSWKFIKKVSLG